jgi:hypothetical protein
MGLDREIWNLVKLGTLPTSRPSLFQTGGAAAPFTMTGAGNALQYYITNAKTSGTIRGQYLRLYLTGGAGGEALRAFTTVSNNAPADTVNGAHISLDFGATVGNITGLGTAVRATLHIPNRSLTGTYTAVMAEIWGDGASSAIGGQASFIRMVAGGTAAPASMDTSGFLFDIQGLAVTTGKLIYIHTGSAPANSDGSIRIKIGATTYYIMVYTQQAA